MEIGDSAEMSKLKISYNHCVCDDKFHAGVDMDEDTAAQELMERCKYARYWESEG